MILSSDEMHFKLIVASGVNRGQRATLVYDSHSDCWQRADGVLVGSAADSCSGGFHEAQTIACRGNLYSTIRTANDEFKLVKFDLQQRTWSPIQVPETLDFPWKLLEHDGKILLMSRNPRSPSRPPSSFAFYELKDSEIPSWTSFKSLPLIRLFEAMGRGCEGYENLQFLECLGQGDSMFCIGSKFSTSPAFFRSLGSWKLSFNVGVHNFATNSDVLTGWEDSEMGGCQSYLRSWQIFRPSRIPCV